ncbi:MAG: hypothetical protein UV70_C0005G0045 [Parcubacteria group bacterium GW2011_GWA2_43_13]|nr:MAG: hypothetical protein UV70_C0005G0045 [Parcubacteria group bacterium GW2011_GWA2_43_13]HAZ16511.1 hypothetical protein [Candidatus Jacksonbacteria bacterium]
MILLFACSLDNNMKFSLSKKQSQRVQAQTLIAIIAASLLVLNLIVSVTQVRFDFTKNKEFSLSPVTKQTLNTLDDIVNIKAYFSKDLNARLRPIRDNVRDLLEEYAAQSHGKLLITFIDPKETPGIETELATVGVPSIQFEIIENDKYELAQGYMGIGIFYGDKKEGIPVINSIETLEYDLTAGIKKITRSSTPVIGYVTSNGTLSSEEQIQSIVKDVRQRYEWQDIDLETTTTLPEDLSVLIIAGPTQPFSQSQLYLIDQFVMQDKSLVIFSESHTIGDNLKAEPLDTGLNSLLESYGIKQNNVIIGDLSNSLASFRTQFGQFITQYPLWVKVPQTGMNKESALVNRLEGVVFPWSADYTISNDAAQPLIETTDRAWEKPITESLDPTNQQAGSQQGKRVIAAQIIGAASSYFKEKDAPPILESSQSPLSEKKNNTTNARIFAIADSDFLKDNFTAQFTPNVVLALNIIDAAAQDEALLSIRARIIDMRPIKELDQTQKMFIKWGNIVIIPLLLGIFGITRFLLRKKRT